MFVGNTPLAILQNGPGAGMPAMTPYKISAPDVDERFIPASSKKKSGMDKPFVVMDDHNQTRHHLEGASSRELLRQTTLFFSLSCKSWVRQNASLKRFPIPLHSQGGVFACHSCKQLTQTLFCRKFSMLSRRDDKNASLNAFILALNKSCGPFFEMARRCIRFLHSGLTVVE